MTRYWLGTPPAVRERWEPVVTHPGHEIEGFRFQWDFHTKLKTPKPYPLNQGVVQFLCLVLCSCAGLTKVRSRHLHVEIGGRCVVLSKCRHQVRQQTRIFEAVGVAYRGLTNINNMRHHL